MGDTKTKQNEEQFKTTLIEGFQLSRTFVDSAARIRDVELGERLGYSRVRDVRALIKALIKSGKLKNVHERGAAPRSVFGPDQAAVEYWLTRTQALKVITRAETEPADQLSDEIIAVFEAYLDGRMRPANNNGISLDDVRLLVAPILTLLDQHSNQLRHLYSCASLNGRISVEDRCLVAALKRQIARKEVLAKRFQKLSQANCDIQRELREATGWGGKNELQADMPAGVVGKALTCLRNRLDAVNRQLQTMKQTGFDFGEN